MRGRYPSVVDSCGLHTYTNHQSGSSSGSLTIGCRSFSKVAFNVSVVYDPLD
jgi:hypothetical protein